MSRNNSGRHELGQNFLVDTSVIQRIATLASVGTGPLVEWGAGDGALTFALQGLGRSLEAVEIDPVRAASLRRRVGPHVCIAEGDILRHAPPVGSTVVFNVPFPPDHADSAPSAADRRLAVRRPPRAVGGGA